MALWTPSDLAVPPLVWFDAADTGTLTKDGSGNVSSWSNKGSLGGNAAPGITPVYSATGLNARPALYFTNAFLQFAASIVSGLPSGASDSAMMAVGSNDNNGAEQYALFHGSLSAGAGRLLYKTSGNKAGLSTIASGNALAAAQTWNSGGNVVVGQIVGTSQMLWINVDGNTASTGTANALATSNTSATICSLTGGEGALWSGWIQKIFIFGYILSTDERQRLEGWAAWDCGLQGNLPAGHPYKAAAPTTGTTPSSTGSASGSGAASGVGQASSRSSASAIGIGIATGVGQAASRSTGSASGAGNAQGTGSSRAASIGASDGSGTASGTGSAASLTAGSATGAGAASGVSQPTASANGSAAGQGAASGVGMAGVVSTGTAAGSSTVLGYTSANATVVATGSATGQSVVSGIGQARATAAGYASGIAIVAGTGAAAASSTGNASGGSTAGSVSGGTTITAMGSAVGSAVGMGYATALIRVNGAAFGLATGSGGGRAIVRSTGSSVGVGSGAGQWRIVFRVTGSAYGTAVVLGRAATKKIAVPGRRTATSQRYGRIVTTVVYSRVAA